MTKQIPKNEFILRYAYPDLSHEKKPSQDDTEKNKIKKIQN